MLITNAPDQLAASTIGAPKAFIPTINAAVIAGARVIVDGAPGENRILTVDMDRDNRIETTLSPTGQLSDYTVTRSDRTWHKGGPAAGFCPVLRRMIDKYATINLRPNSHGTFAAAERLLGNAPDVISGLSVAYFLSNSTLRMSVAFGHYTAVATAAERDNTFRVVDPVSLARSILTIRLDYRTNEVIDGEVTYSDEHGADARAVFEGATGAVQMIRTFYPA